MKNIRYERPQIEDLEQIVFLLKENDLPVDDIHSNSCIQFVVAKFDDFIIGSVALERFNSIGLLRSLWVKEEFRKDGVGLSLINRVFDFARNEKLSEIYLLTTSANKYFAKFGFNELNRKNAPIQIQETSQFRDLCPASAILMNKAM